ncbi:MAG: winged helix-turn-helix domain-containing protein [Deltaproteobacteria bacterium]|nr:winged helix-turn-helix domain-containing protein [Deltaproteobacteria bacterium]
MLDAIIGSKTRIGILVKLFLNPATRAYLRQLATEFDVSTNAVRTELNSLTEHGLLTSEKDGRSIYYRANRKHPLFPELASAVRKMTGIDSLVTSVIERLGELESAWLVGDYAEGKDTGVIDVVLVGQIDQQQLQDVIAKTERYIQRKIRPLIITAGEFEAFRDQGTLGSVMCLWSRESGTVSAIDTKEQES